MSKSPYDNYQFPKKTQIRSNHDWKVTTEMAKQLLSIMNKLSGVDHDGDEEIDTRGNNYSCVIIADGGNDPIKNDPTLSTLVILPNEIVMLARPMNEQDKVIFPNPGKSIGSHNVERLSIDAGLSIAAEKLAPQKNTSALIISDCPVAEESIKNSVLAIRQSPMTLTIRHPNKDANVSPEHKALHMAVHDMCQHVRKRMKSGIIDMHISKQEIEALAKPLSIFRPEL